MMASAIRLQISSLLTSSIDRALHLVKSLDFFAHASDFHMRRFIIHICSARSGIFILRVRYDVKHHHNYKILKDS